MPSVSFAPTDVVRAVADSLAAAAVLHRRGAIELRNPIELLRTARDATALGPAVTTLAHATRVASSATALIDDRGPITFEQLDHASGPTVSTRPISRITTSNARCSRSLHASPSSSRKCCGRKPVVKNRLTRRNSRRSHRP
ncbi:hypothetical protein FNL39_10784 [Nocardia caishijiensis]|uniref:Uncharacterized protein n=1 Tax=Nocardia caishijiensis TaxID=184756 RepID=A0ABQ6YI64_9NOCA|nr:hypothetical protein FNL39_10784 [Nocardia caishijiensis]